MMIAIYCRVSTFEQSVDMQCSDLRRYCEQRGFEIFKEYIDEGVSGATERRPNLDALMHDARKRLFNIVLCWRFDRFARSTQHLINALQEFRHLGIDFISYQENIDTGSPLGTAMFTIVAAIAELERNIIVERIRGVLRRAKDQGKRLGRRPLTDPDLLRTVMQLKAEGHSIRAIAKAMKLSKSFVHKTCQNHTSKSLEFSV
jgi:DNA invertase Pin-like site-specific DNA recombinase